MPQPEDDYRTHCKTCLRLQIGSLNQLKVGNGGFKSPLSKGGFRGIIRRLSNPPCPPLEKGGDYVRAYAAWLIQEDIADRF